MSCDSTASTVSAPSSFASECRTRDYSIVLGNSALDFQTIVSDSYSDDLLIGGTVIQDSTTHGFITLIDMLTCSSKFYKKVEGITRVQAVLRDRITSNKFYYMVGYDASDSEFIFRFDDFNTGIVMFDVWEFEQPSLPKYALSVGLAQYNSWLIVTSLTESKIIDFSDTLDLETLKLTFTNEQVLTSQASVSNALYVTQQTNNQL